MEMMRKKRVCFLGLVLLSLLFAACGKKEVKEEETQPVKTESITQTGTKEPETTQEETYEVLTGSAYERSGIEEELLAELIENNMFCYLWVFGVETLPTTTEVTYEENKNNYLYEINPTMFASYQEFEEYIYSIYDTDEAKRLLNYPDSAHPMYVNVDGKLCIDYRYRVVEESTVDWYNYEYVIFDEDENHCRFKLYTYKDDKDYEVVGEAISRNGDWVLTNMIK